VSTLEGLYPDANCALQHANALQLLVATMLSAQSTDKLVNSVTPALFARYPDARAFAGARREDLERAVHSTGFFRQKAKNVQLACELLVAEHDGQVPDTMEALTALPGVARKTANVVLGTWFRKPEGIVVDTHVGRLSQRLALAWTTRDPKDAVKIEADLMRVLPRSQWTFFSHALILHGRAVCSSQRPRCAACDLAPDCPSAGTFEVSARRSRPPARHAGLRRGRAVQRARRGALLHGVGECVAERAHAGLVAAPPLDPDRRAGRGQARVYEKVDSGH
jgi:endonuclease-3